MTSANFAVLAVLIACALAVPVLGSLGPESYNDYFVLVKKFNDTSCTDEIDWAPSQSTFSLTSILEARVDLHGSCFSYSVKDDPIDESGCVIDATLDLDCLKVGTGKQTFAENDVCELENLPGEPPKDRMNSVKTYCKKTKPLASDISDLTCMTRQDVAALITQDVLRMEMNGGGGTFPPDCGKSCWATGMNPDCAALQACTSTCSGVDKNVMDLYSKMNFGCSCTLPQKCGDIKEAYRSNDCCAKPLQTFDMDLLHKLKHSKSRRVEATSSPAVRRAGEDAEEEMSEAELLRAIEKKSIAMMKQGGFAKVREFQTKIKNVMAKSGRVV